MAEASAEEAEKAAAETRRLMDEMAIRAEKAKEEQRKVKESFEAWMALQNLPPQVEMCDLTATDGIDPPDDLSPPSRSPVTLAGLLSEIQEMDRDFWTLNWLVGAVYAADGRCHIGLTCWTTAPQWYVGGPSKMLAVEGLQS